MLSCVLRGAVLYPLVIFAVRLMGKRQIGELQPAELVVTILISNIATLPLEDHNLPLLMGVVPVLVLVSFEVIVSWLSLRFRGFRKLISGSPKIIVKDGVIDQQMMKTLRFSLDDLMTALRSSGVFDMNEVQMAVVETNGSVSVYQKTAYQPATKGDVVTDLQPECPPEVLIADGEVSLEGMTAAGYTNKRLQTLLKQQKVTAEEVFLLTVNEKGLHCLVKKEHRI
ncbi:MAG: DUF421 domain-containing protein [Oscillospiraceae bacterium]